MLFISKAATAFPSQEDKVDVGLYGATRLMHTIILRTNDTPPPAPPAVGAVAPLCHRPCGSRLDLPLAVGKDRIALVILERVAVVGFAAANATTALLLVADQAVEPINLSPRLH